MSVSWHKHCWLRIDSECKVSDAIKTKRSHETFLPTKDFTSSSLSSIQVLSSMFNLMRNLFRRLCSGVLTQIDALLGAPIVLPKIMLSPDNRDVDLFDELDDERARQVLDMHFYAANYWRECVSAFVTQLDQMMRRKVLTRLTEVIELENEIREIMQTAPDDYVPPVCLFTSEKIATKFKRPARIRIREFCIKQTNLILNIQYHFSTGGKESSNGIEEAKSCRQIGH